MNFPLAVGGLTPYIFRMANQYRYSKTSFHKSVYTAVGLTVIISFLVWLFSRLMAFSHPYWITIVAGGVFFSFCSAAMIYRYVRDEIVLAVRPDGLFDARHSSQAVPWEQIKEVRLERQENEFQLLVQLWPMGEAPPKLIWIDLSPLDAGVESVLQAIAPHARISVDHA